MALREVTTQKWCGTDDLTPAYNLEVFLGPKRSGSIPFLKDHRDPGNWTKPGAFQRTF
jgi:hypothetical protein